MQQNGLISQGQDDAPLRLDNRALLSLVPSTIPLPPSYVMLKKTLNGLSR